ncbi:SPW repeat domain-containing protein [Galbibacter sp. BG1]
MWARFINIAIGLWLMISPSLLDFNDMSKNNAHIVGPIVITFSIIGISGATRNVRLWNFPLAFWLLVSPWILNYENHISILHHVVSGILILFFCTIKGKITRKYGGGWSALWSANSKHIQLNNEE